MTRIVERLRIAGRALIRPERLLLAALALVAVLPFGHLFAGNTYLWQSAGAVVVVALVSVTLSPRRPLAAALWAAVAALALYLLVVVFHGAFGSVLTGVTASWKNLLGASVPVVADPELLAAPVLLAAVAGFAGLELASRTRAVVLPAVPAIAALLVSLLYTGQRPLGAPVVPVLMVVGVLAVALLRANRSVAAEAAGVAGPLSHAAVATHDGGSWRARVPLHLRLGVPVLGAVAAVALLGGGFLPLADDAARVDLRDRFHPDVDLADERSPLADVKAGLNDDRNPVMFTVRLDGVPAGHPPIDRVRIAALDEYDGAVWQTRGTFRKVGAEVPAGAPLRVPADRITQHYTLSGDYRSSFLPELDRPVAVQADDVGFDRSTGTLVRDRPSPGFSYEITSAVPRYDDVNRLRASAPGIDPTVADLSLPPATAGPVPEEIENYAHQPQFEKGNPFDSMKAVEDDLRSDAFGYSAQAIAGHSYAVLKGFLGAEPGADRKDGARVGYSEQTAAALALVARLKGFPSRVAVGYKVPEPTQAPGRDVEVHAKDIHAWAEVHLNGIGWVPFDGANTNPNPPVPPTTSPTTAVPNTSTTSAGQGLAPLALGDQPGCDPVTGVCAATGGGTGWWLLLLLAVLVLIVAPAVVVLLKALRRRRRRSRGSPAQRAVGAWREVLDRLRVYGLAGSRSMTARELSSRLGERAGGSAAARVADLGPVLDSALYSPDDPPEDVARRAWDAEAGLADAIRERSGLWRRARAAVDPRPLVGGRR
jgi:transglutaminase-like putative cysteine protease